MPKISFDNKIIKGKAEKDRTFIGKWTYDDKELSEEKELFYQ